MTVQELINKLEKIKDKEKPVMITGSTALTDALWHWHFRDQPHQLLVG
jgi:hypothetical protein